MRYLLLSCTVLAIVCALQPARAAGENAVAWKVRAGGVEYGLFRIDAASSNGDGLVHIVRIDPSKAELKAVLASEHDRKTRTASEWCAWSKLFAAINAGMYQADYLTNVGYLRNGRHVQNSHWKEAYRSALAFGPKKAGIPGAVLVDLDEPGSRKGLDDYRTVIQNLRILKGGAVNVWKDTSKKWSETAVGSDDQGRILLIFCRTPYDMRTFGERLKALSLGLNRLMHVEGGPQASLSVHSADINVSLAGSHGSRSVVSDLERGQWPIPNVIGVTVK